MDEVDRERAAAEEAENWKRQNSLRVAREEDAQHRDTGAHGYPVPAEIRVDRGELKHEVFHATGPGRPVVIVIRETPGEES